MARERDMANDAKNKLFQALGGSCARCGFSDQRALQLDHVNGGGMNELRKSGNRRWLYRKVLRETEAGLASYQLLCANCNWIKRHENGEHGNSGPGTYR